MCHIVSRDRRINRAVAIFSLLNYAMSQSIGEKNSTSEIMHAVTHASSTKRVFILRDYALVTLPLNLRKIEDSIDRIKNRIVNLKYDTHPSYYFGRQVVNNENVEKKVTIFNRAVSFFDASNVHMFQIRIEASRFS